MSFLCAGTIIPNTSNTFCQCGFYKVSAATELVHRDLQHRSSDLLSMSHRSNQNEIVCEASFSHGALSGPIPYEFIDLH